MKEYKKELDDTEAVREKKEDDVTPNPRELENTSANIAHM
jgi:hypothetical protein